MLLENLDRLGRRGHVGAFGHADAAVLHECGGLVAVQLVLRGARHGDVAFHAPRTLACVVGRFGIAVGVLLDAPAEDVFQLHDVFQLFGRDARGVEDVARRIGERHDLGAELGGLLGGVLRHVARAGDADRLAFEREAARREHLLREVACSVSRRFGAHRRAPPADTLAGESTGEFVAQTFVLPEHEADFAAAHADVARRNVGVLSDVARQFGDERLAETHHLVVGFAFGVEVRTALAAAHRQCREAVLEGLLEGEEFQDREVHRRVEPNTSFIGTDSAVHLYAVAAVDLDLALVVEPGHAEDDDALGFGDAFEHLHLAQDGVHDDVLRQRFGNLLHRLMKFGFTGVFGNDSGHEFVDKFLCFFLHN